MNPSPDPFRDLPIASRVIRTFATHVNQFGRNGPILGWLPMPAHVQNAVQNLASVLVLWADALDEEQAKNRRRAAMKMVRNLAHPGPECECSECLRNPENL